MNRRICLCRAAGGAGAMLGAAWARAGDAIPFKGAGSDAALPAGATVLLALLIAGLAASLVFAWYRRRPTRTARAGAGLLQALLARPAAGGTAITVLECARLDLRTSLYAVQWQGRQLLLASSEQGVVVLVSDAAPGETA